MSGTQEIAIQGQTETLLCSIQGDGASCSVAINLQPERTQVTNVAFPFVALPDYQLPLSQGSIFTNLAIRLQSGTGLAESKYPRPNIYFGNDVPRTQLIFKFLANTPYQHEIPLISADPGEGLQLLQAELGLLTPLAILLGDVINCYQIFAAQGLEPKLLEKIQEVVVEHKDTVSKALFLAPDSTEYKKLWKDLDGLAKKINKKTYDKDFYEQMSGQATGFKVQAHCVMNRFVYDPIKYRQTDILNLSQTDITARHSPLQYVETPPDYFRCVTLSNEFGLAQMSVQSQTFAHGLKLTAQTDRTMALTESQAFSHQVLAKLTVGPQLLRFVGGFLKFDPGMNLVVQVFENPQVNQQTILKLNDINTQFLQNKEILLQKESQLILITPAQQPVQQKQDPRLSVLSDGGKAVKQSSARINSALQDPPRSPNFSPIAEPGVKPSQELLRQLQQMKAVVEENKKQILANDAKLKKLDRPAVQAELGDRDVELVKSTLGLSEFIYGRDDLLLNLLGSKKHEIAFKLLETCCKVKARADESLEKRQLVKQREAAVIADQEKLIKTLKFEISILQRKLSGLAAVPLQQSGISELSFREPSILESPKHQQSQKRPRSLLGDSAMQHSYISVDNNLTHMTDIRKPPKILANVSTASKYLDELLK